MSEVAQFDQAENPYRSSGCGTLAAEHEETLQGLPNELCFFVGRNADYYLKKWAPRLDDPQADVGMNWAAFLLTGLWLAYRKMYAFAFIFFGAAILERFMEAVVFLGLLRLPAVPGGVNLIYSLASAIICGLFGNSWYLSHARRKVAEVHAQGLEGERLLFTLSQRGGTSLLAPIGLIIVGSILVFMFALCYAIFIRLA
jgi:Protein of unknown function (DUF2628)